MNISKKLIVPAAGLAIIALGIGLKLSRQSPKTVQTAAPTKHYIALGDSVAAGAGLPTAYDTTSCDRNKESYPVLVAQKLNYKLTDLACSGASIPAGLSGGQNSNGLMVPAQLDAMPASSKPDLITLSIGANDLNWASILTACYTATCGTAADTAQLATTIAQYRTSLGSVFTAIKNRYPSGTPPLIMTTYYDVFPSSGTCSDTNGITAAEVTWWRAETKLFEAAIAESAASFPFVKVVKADFTGHELCTTTPWVQNLSAKAPFHPTDAGQAAIAKAISEKTLML